MQNITLLGAKGSGKTTLAKALKEQRGYEVLSSDSLIVEIFLKSIKDYQREINSFKDLESKIKKTNLLTFREVSKIVGLKNFKRLEEKALAFAGKQIQDLNLQGKVCVLDCGGAIIFKADNSINAKNIRLLKKIDSKILVITTEFEKVWQRALKEAKEADSEIQAWHPKVDLDETQKNDLKKGKLSEKEALKIRKKNLYNWVCPKAKKYIELFPKNIFNMKSDSKQENIRQFFKIIFK
jgi:shikimate kinase